jgi:cytochrome c-type biogenesis protein CcmE
MFIHTKLFVAAIAVAGAASWLAFLGAASTWQYYLHVDECVAEKHKFGDCRLRVSGRIAPGSLVIADNRSTATFVLQGESHSLSSICQGPLPDNLAEEMDVVVEGRLEVQGMLPGDQDITRSASKYEAESAKSQ